VVLAAAGINPKRLQDPASNPLGPRSCPRDEKLRT
jgi:hypothetical protein